MEFDLNPDYHAIIHTERKSLRSELPFGKPEEFVSLFPVSVQAHKNPDAHLGYAGINLVLTCLQLGNAARFGIDGIELINLVEPLKEFLTLHPEVKENMLENLKVDGADAHNVYFLHYYEPFELLPRPLLKEVFLQVAARFQGVWVCSLNYKDIVRSQELDLGNAELHFGIQGDAEMEAYQEMMRRSLPLFGFGEVGGSGYWIRELAIHEMQ